jgi:ATP-dependent helicase Lhr and Lhr-like helicase
MSRRWLDPSEAADIGKLDAQAIERVRAEAWPDAATADELHDALLWMTFLTDAERDSNPGWPLLMADLAAQGRVLHIVAATQASLWVATERRKLFEPISDESLVDIVRGRLEALGPVTAARIGASLSLSAAGIGIALAALEAQGFAMRGRFTSAAMEEEWCERRLLARIHLCGTPGAADAERPSWQVVVLPGPPQAALGIIWNGRCRALGICAPARQRSAAAQG